MLKGVRTSRVKGCVDSIMVISSCSVSKSQDVFFVAILQGWVYKTQQRDACEQSDAFVVTPLQGWAYKTQQTPPTGEHATTECAMSTKHRKTFSL